MMFCDGRQGLRSLLPMLALAITLLSGCDSPDSNTSPSQVTNLTGTVTGVIQDTRGQGISGAQITYSGASGNGAPLSVTSNSDGSFQMAGVIISSVSGATVNGANGPLTLVVTAPGGKYLGATVTVSPVAAQTSTTIGGAPVFLDGFNVGVGNIRLPQLNSTVSGVVRSASTGAAVSGAFLSLSFVDVEATQTTTVTGVVTSYSAPSIVATSDASGNFSFTAVYDDSCVQLLVNDFAISAISGSSPPCTVAGAATETGTVNLKTSDLHSPVALGNVSVEAPNTADTVPPFVTSVDGVVDPTQDPAQLESSITNQLTVHFSETLLQTAFTASNITVVLGTAPNQTSATVTGAVLSGGDTVVVTVGAAFPAGTAVTLSIPLEELKDTSGNIVTATGTAIAYDSSTGEDLVLSFVSFDSTSTIAAAATVTQVNTQAIPGDLAYISTDALLDTVATSPTPGNALTENGIATAYPTTATIEQLSNPAADTDLNALVLAFNPSDTRTVNAGVARVNIVLPTSATDVVVWVERAGVKQNALFYPIATAGGSPTNSAEITNNGPTYVITPGGATSFDLVIRSGSTSTYTVQPGDVLHVTSRNAAAVSGGTSTLTFLENGHPTVALQLLNLAIAASSGNATGGSGGVVSPGNGATPGTVLLSITPQAADVNDTTSGYASDNWRGANELQGLSNTALQNSAFAASLSSGDQAIGDAEGTDSFTGGTSTTLGIAVTEPVTYITGSAPTTTNVTATLSHPGVQDNATAEDGTVSNLFVATVSNIFQLAADATPGNAQIDISATIEDSFGVAPDAGTRALVLLHDSMPPLMTRAFYDGTNYVFVFNEAVSGSGTIAFSPATTGPAAACTLTVTLSASTQTSPTTFVVPATAVPSPNCFAVATYAEPDYTAAALGSLTTVTPNPDPPHGAVTYVDVIDAAGNTWTSWDSEDLGIGAPYFAIANIAPVSAP